MSRFEVHKRGLTCDHVDTRASSDFPGATTATVGCSGFYDTIGNLPWETVNRRAAADGWQTRGTKHYCPRHSRRRGSLPHDE